MLTTVLGVMREGKIEPLEKLNIPNGTKILLTLIPEDRNEFWLEASQDSLDKIWNNEEDNIYGALLKK